MEKRHFIKTVDISPKGNVQNFTDNDYENPQKNIMRFQELALQSGLVYGKSAIYKNTLGAVKALKDSPLPVVAWGQLNFPIYSNLVILEGTYQNNSGDTIGVYPQIELNAVLLEIEHENNIITTDIQGRSGTVIEYVGAKSPRVKVTGSILTQAGGTYPRTDVQNLLTALYSNRPLNIISWFLDMAGIKSLMVIRDSIKQEEGSQEYQKFEFEAFADAPVVLKLQKSNIDNLSTSPIS